MVTFTFQVDKVKFLSTHRKNLERRDLTGGLKKFELQD